MNSTQVKQYSLKQLKTFFEEDRLAIPEIQRQYVWNKKQVVDLMDSIYHGYPIGVSMLWKAPYSKAIHIRPNHKSIIPPFNQRNKEVDLVIDGQQRLSTLYGVLFCVPPRPDAESQVDFSQLFFDCRSTSDKRFVFNANLDDNSKGYARLSTLLITSPQRLKNKLKLTQAEARAAEKCYYNFHEYMFFMMTFEGYDYKDVKETFIRINSAGTRINRADALFARATDVNLRDHLLNARRRLKHGYDTISVQAMQNTIALAYGATNISAKGYQSFIKELEKDKKNNKNFHRIWRDLEYGYEEAADFLVNHLKVLSPTLLPSQNLYSILAYFFYLNKSRVKGNQLKEIKKWFWHTCCAERYSGAGFNTNIPGDIKFFQSLQKNPITARYTITGKIEPLDFLRTNYKSSGSLISAVYRLMLRSKKPLYLANGQEMLLDGASSISNRKDQHHIFPKDLLEKNSIAARWTNSITNICYLESDENQSIGKKHPSLYLTAYKKEKHFGRVMNSHLIPSGPSSPVWTQSVKDAFQAFLTDRGKLIIASLERLAGAKMFLPFDGVKRV